MYHILLTPKVCDKVSFGIGDNWRRFGRHLNFIETELDHIKCDNQKTQDRAMAVLNKWMQKMGDPTWEQLRKVLADLQHNDIIMKVEEEFKQGIKT